MRSQLAQLKAFQALLEAHGQHYYNIQLDEHLTYNDWDKSDIEQYQILKLTEFFHIKLFHSMDAR